jgi:hypothetical protein
MRFVTSTNSGFMGQSRFLLKPLLRSACTHKAAAVLELDEWSALNTYSVRPWRSCDTGKPSSASISLTTSSSTDGPADCSAALSIGSLTSRSYSSACDKGGIFLEIAVKSFFSRSRGTNLLYAGNRPLSIAFTTSI